MWERNLVKIDASEGLWANERNRLLTNGIDYSPLH